MRLFIVLVAGFITACQTQPNRLFTQIDPDESGVQFANTLEPTPKLNAFTFTNFYNGGGVGVGDFNHDGRPDLFFTGNQVSCRLYINQTDTPQHNPAPIRFADVTESSGIQTDRWCTGVSVVDINQDGWDDIYVSVAAHTALKKTHNLLFINQKTPSPTFREEAALYGLNYEGFTTQAAFFDYDRDGDLDCFLLNTAPDLQNPNSLRPAVNDGSYPSTGRLYRNLKSERVKEQKGSQMDSARHQPDSLFEDVSAQAGIRFEGLGLGLVVSDLNNDGWPDLYISNDFISSDILYLNKGDGTFRNTVQASMAHTSLYGMGVDAGDLNNDGRPDLLQLDMLPETNERLKQMLAGQDYDKKEQSLKPQYGYQLQYMRNSLQLNMGNLDTGIPEFTEVGLLAGVARTDWSWAPLLADFDLDGDRDVFITNGYRKNVTDRDFVNFTEEFDLFGTDEARQRQRDKLIDKIPEVKLNNYAFRNEGGLVFRDISGEWGLDEASYANGAAYADLDLDGDLDLIVNNIDEAASIFRNNSCDRRTDGFIQVSFDGGPANKTGLGATLTTWAGNQRQHYENQPVRGYLSSVQTGVWMGIGNQPKVDSMRVTWPNGRVETRYNVAPNQRITFRVSDANQPKKNHQLAPKPLFRTEPDPFEFVHEESDYVDFKTTPALHKMLSRTGVSLATGDLNGDGFDDVVVGPSYRGSPGVLFFAQKNGTFRRQNWLIDSPMEAGDIQLFDADGDHDLDVLVAGGGNERPLSVAEAYQPVLYRNDGRGTLLPAPGALPRMRVSSTAIRAFDYDRDGDQDVLLTGRQIPGQYPLPTASYLLQNDGGRFTDVTKQVAPALAQVGMVCDALPIDIDNDTDLDLVLVGEWMPPTLLLNQNGQKLLPAPSRDVGPSLSSEPGWWNCVSAADFDHDGDQDLLLGNEGLNTFYGASPGEPVQIIGKDFNQDGQFDPIMGYFIRGTCYPALPRESLNQQIIQFRRKYPRYADYANVTFMELFTSEERANAYWGQASQLRSCYAENLGNGQFRLKPLPILAQVSPIFGFLIDDFDQDGHLDALATGNFYPNEVNMGRQDASRGLFLRGNGKGQFVAVNPATSGFRLGKDARKSYRIRPGNRIVTAVNSGPFVVHSWFKKK